MSESLAFYAQRIINGLEPHEAHGIARMLEDEIERRGLIWQYMTALHVVQWRAGWGTGPIEQEELWCLLRATPGQRARAFLEVM
jgi:hypothetical protein